MKPAALVFSFSLVIAGHPALASGVCKAEVHRAGKFDLRQIGPLIEGVWIEEAIGARPGLGLQHGLMEISYDRNRNCRYLGGGGDAMTELVSSRRNQKASSAFSQSARPWGPRGTQPMACANRS